MVNVRFTKKANKPKQSESIISDRCKLSSALNSDVFPDGFYSSQAKPTIDTDWQAKLDTAKARLRRIESQQSKQSQKMNLNELVSIECEVWVLRGIVDHKHSEDDLKAILKRHQKINKVPKGYNYPELMR